MAPIPPLYPRFGFVDAISRKEPPLISLGPRSCPPCKQPLSKYRLEVFEEGLHSSVLAFVALELVHIGRKVFCELCLLSINSVEAPRSSTKNFEAMSCPPYAA